MNDSKVQVKLHRGNMGHLEEAHVCLQLLELTSYFIERNAKFIMQHATACIKLCFSVKMEKKEQLELL